MDEKTLKPGTHIPVLEKEVVAFLRPKTGGVYVDCTLGLGGHTLALFNACKDIKIYAIDADCESMELAKKNLTSFNSNINFLWSNFKEIGSIIPEKVDGILFDLGLSSFHIDTPDRGFSHRFDSPIDMRFNRESGLPCYKMLEKLKVDDLEFILKEYGEEYLARRIARLVIESKPKTTMELRDIIANITPWKGRSKTLGRVFQALRIFMNDELNSLSKGIEDATKLLKPRGRICTIAYHSLEDRIIKRYFRTSQELREVTHRAVVPTDFEIENNHRARSAKMRCAERIEEGEKERLREKGMRERRKDRDGGWGRERRGDWGPERGRGNTENREILDADKRR
ncbi:MAG: 16S rRNA (cytosine(1402)-N(4))-methyltransferase RsmH [bacterium]